MYASADVRVPIPVFVCAVPVATAVVRLRLDVRPISVASTELAAARAPSDARLSAVALWDTGCARVLAPRSAAFPSNFVLLVVRPDAAAPAAAAVPVD